MRLRRDHRSTLRACYICSATTAIVNNFVPLLFLTFQRTYAISLEHITLLVTLNFLTQLVVDLLAARYVDRIGHRVSAVAAQLLCALGLAGLAFLPDLLPSAYPGMVLCIVLYAMGGGLNEVLGSSIVEACPTENKSASMSLLHSFYCWGSITVILGSTLFFWAFGANTWQVLSLVWAAIPLVNAFYFSTVPLYRLHEGGKPMPMRRLLSKRLFWIFAALMVCAGAAELSMSQWASAFAEAGLGVSKTVGDLAGPCMFAVMMGVSRAVYARWSNRLPLVGTMIASGVLCMACYLLAGLSTSPVAALIGCAVCGMAVGVFWPGTLSLASEKFPSGGTALFGLLALAGDLGCSTGPTVVGFVASGFGGRLQDGLLVAMVFPLALMVFLAICLRLVQTRKPSTK